eukprot:scaffold17330_cov161-Amphora_coffeaeformis.AAC.2
MITYEHVPPREQPFNNHNNDNNHNNNANDTRSRSSLDLDDNNDNDDNDIFRHHHHHHPSSSLAAASTSTTTALSVLSATDAVMHLIKGNLGPGCLNLPLVFGGTGPFLGGALLVLIAIQGIYSMMLLTECKGILLLLVSSSSSTTQSHPHHYHHQQQQHHHANHFTFMDVAQASLGRVGHVAVQVLLFVLQTGVCCVFLSLLVTNLQATNVLAVVGSSSSSRTVCVICVTASLMVVCSLLRNLKDLRLLSSTANAFMVLAIGTATVAGWRQYLQSHNNEDQQEDNDGTASSTTTTTTTTTPWQVLNFITSMFFSLEGIGLVLPVENGYCQPPTTTKKNQTFRRVILPTAMTIVAVLFLMVGVSASIGFPDIQTGSITAYLEERYPHNVWYSTVNVLVMLAVFMTFPLQLTPAMEVLEEWWTIEDDDDDDDENVHDTHGADEPVGLIHANTNFAPTSTRTVTNEASFPMENRVDDDEPAADYVEGPPLDETPVEVVETDEGRQYSYAYLSYLYHHYGWIVHRCCVILGCAGVVLAVDDLSALVSLFGAVGQTGLAAMPCACHLALQRQGRAPLHTGKTIANISTIVFCALVMVAGLIGSIVDISKHG